MASKSSRELKRNPWPFTNGITGPVCGPDSCSPADCGHCPPAACTVSVLTAPVSERNEACLRCFGVGWEHLSFLVELLEWNELLTISVSLYTHPLVPCQNKVGKISYLVRNSKNGWTVDSWALYGERDEGLGAVALLSKFDIGLLGSGNSMCSLI